MYVIRKCLITGFRQNQDEIITLNSGKETNFKLKMCIREPYVKKQTKKTRVNRDLISHLFEPI